MGGSGLTSATRTHDELLGEGDAAVEAYVVEPAGSEIRAGILFLHWLGEHRSDRTEFLSEARQHARTGVRCVLPAGRLPWDADPVDADTDTASLEIEQARLGAAVDRLVDGLPPGAPLGLVGHDFGAMHGLVLAARRPVFAATVVIAATPRWGDWLLRFWKLEGDRFEYLRALAPYDPVTTARDLRGDVLWQFSERDYFIAAMSAVELARAAPLPDGVEPRIEWYRSDHAMGSPSARRSRTAFLGQRLSLG